MSSDSFSAAGEELQPPASGDHLRVSHRCFGIPYLWEQQLWLLGGRVMFRNAQGVLKGWIPQLRYRRMLAGDIPAIAALDQLCFAREEQWPPKLLQSLAVAPEAYNLVAEVDGELVGYCITDTASASDALGNTTTTQCIASLAVHKRYRRCGIAHQMLQLTLKALGPGYVYLSVMAHNTAAQNLYKKLNFFTVGNRQQPARIIMRKLVR